MTITRRELLATAALAGGTALIASPAAMARRQTAPAHVVLIDWDGFGSDLLARVPMPNLQALIALGSLTIADSTYAPTRTPRAPR